MADEFKLDFQPTDSGELRAEFRDLADDLCAIQESTTEGGDTHIYLGLECHRSREREMRAGSWLLNREMAEAIGVALLGFALNGTLARNLIGKPLGKPLAVGCTLEFVGESGEGEVLPWPAGEDAKRAVREYEEKSREAEGGTI